LAPQYTEVIPCEDTFIKGYLYGISSEKKQVFERDEVIHFKRPNPSNLYYGLGKIEAAYGAVLSNQAVHDMDLAMFQNSARPDYAVVVRGTPTSDQLDRFQEQVEQRLKGTRRDGNFIAVTGDVQFTPLNFPPKDLAGRDEIVEEIAAVFGVPVSMLKANDPNLASAKTGFAQWREGTILPLLRMDEEELNQSLVPLFGLDDELCLAYDNPVPADRDYELRERQTAVAGGWRTPNEARIEEGKEEVEDEYAGKLLVNGNPLGGAAAAGGLGGLGGFGGFAGLPAQTAEPTEAEKEQGVAPDTKTASTILKSIRHGEMATYSGVKLLQSLGFPRSIAEKMIDAEEKARKIERTDGDLYETREEAEAVAALLGCSGFHTHDVDGQTMYMPCSDMEDYTRLTGQQHTSEDDPTLEGKGPGCDDCGGGSKPRPKVYRPQSILDGASTEKMLKSFERWSLIVKSEDCGTGAGGFKPGNTCATGESAQADGAGSSRSEKVDAEQVKQDNESLIQAIYDYQKGGGNKEELAKLFAEADLTPEEALVVFQEAHQYTTAVQETLDSQQDPIGTFTMNSELIGGEDVYDELKNADTPEKIDAARKKSIRLARASMAKDVALSQRAGKQSGALSNNDRETFEAYIESKEGLSSSALNTGFVKYFAEVDEESRGRIHNSYKSLDDDPVPGVADFNDASQRLGMFVEGEDFERLSNRAKKRVVAANKASNQFFDKVEAEGANLSNRLYLAKQESIAAEQFLASRGISSTVDVANFAGEEDVFSWQEGDVPRDLSDPKLMNRYRSAVQRTYEQVYAIADSADNLRQQGYDLSDLGRAHVHVSTRDFGGKTSTETTRNSVSPAKAYFNMRGITGDGDIMLFTDKGGDSLPQAFGDSVERSWLSVDQRAGMAGTVTHEFGHALHRRNMERMGRSERSITDMTEGFFQDAVGGSAPLTSNVWRSIATDENAKVFPSDYSRIKPVEFVAECFATKLHDPERWEKMKNTKLPKSWRQYETVGQIYDILGGP